MDRPTEVYVHIGGLAERGRVKTYWKGGGRRHDWVVHLDIKK